MHTSVLLEYVRKVKGIRRPMQCASVFGVNKLRNVKSLQRSVVRTVRVAFPSCTSLEYARTLHLRQCIR